MKWHESSALNSRSSILPEKDFRKGIRSEEDLHVIIRFHALLEILQVVQH
jgi:hypothetical protein